MKYVNLPDILFIGVSATAFTLLINLALRLAGANELTTTGN